MNRLIFLAWIMVICLTHKEEVHGGIPRTSEQQRFVRQVSPNIEDNGLDTASNMWLTNFIRDTLEKAKTGKTSGQPKEQQTDKPEVLDIEMIQQVFGSPPTTTLKSPTTEMDKHTKTTSSDNIATLSSICLTENKELGKCKTTYGCKYRHSGGFGCEQPAEFCCPESDVLTVQNTNPFTPVKREGCGWRGSQEVKLHIMSDSVTAEFAEFPWAVVVLSVQLLDENNPGILEYTCGGSLIHPSVVLTTAHKIKSNMILRVRAGEWDIRSTLEPYPYQDQNVKNVIFHEKYNATRENLFYDAALLILENPMKLAPNVATVCLPPPMERAPEGLRCVSSGWGKDKFGKKGVYQSLLKKVELPVIDRTTCQNQLRMQRLGPFFKLHPSFMCAGGEPGTDTCEGDGGSALVCPIPSLRGRYVQNGMVAWGIGCGNEIPGVYVDVGYIREWIDEKMTSAGYGIESYTFETTL